MKKRLLVHVCCAPDGIYGLDLLRDEYDPCSFFCNPNIHPAGEYSKRLEEARKVSRILGLPLIEDAYDHEAWESLTRIYKDEPEKGRRCDVCYAWRLKRTAETAAANGFQAFSTVMTVSPWKKAGVINRIGRMLGRGRGLEFVERDMKKNDGFRKSVELCRIYGIYRQDYCGCPRSLQEAVLRRVRRLG